MGDRLFDIGAEEDALLLAEDVLGDLLVQGAALAVDVAEVVAEILDDPIPEYDVGQIVREHALDSLGKGGSGVAFESRLKHGLIGGVGQGDIGRNHLPLYRKMKGEGSVERAFADYLSYGGLPYIASMTNVEEKAEIYLEGFYNTIIIKDIEARQFRRKNDPNKRNVTDMVLLRNITRFVANSIGSPISVKRIADYITSVGRKTSVNTVSDYLEALIEPYIFYPVERYDVVGRQLLKQNRKLYIVDLGLRRHLVARKNYDLGFSLENTICLELLRRGYEVYIGKVGKTEVDYIARHGDEVLYYQVTASMTEQTTFDREIAALRTIPDNYPKTILTLDRYTLGNYDRIKVVNAIDWLLEADI